jgi:hypothetical protein
LPPIWPITLAYSFSAPTATIVLLETAAAVEPAPDEQPAASIVMARAALASAATVRRRGGLTAGMRTDIGWLRLQVTSRRGRAHHKLVENDNRYDFRSQLGLAA